MNRTSLFVSAGALFIVVAAGCQAIANLETRNADPQATGCSLPSSGNGRVRLANMANVGPGSTAANNPLNYSDFCIRPSGSSDWGRPVFRDGGNDALCLGTANQPGGLTYGAITVPFAVPVGKIDVKAIPTGQTCSAAATSEADGIAIGDSVNGNAAVTTLVRWSGGSSKEAIAAHLEEPKDSAKYNGSSIRVINALSNNRSILMGTAKDSFLPTTLDDVTIQVPIAPGSIPAPQPQSNGGGTFQVNSTGYMQFPGQLFNIAASYATDTVNNAIAVFTAEGDLAGTFFAIGDPGDTTNQHPVRAVFCSDTLNATITVVDAGAAGSTSVSNLPVADQKLLGQCTLTNLPILTLDIVNVSLYGPNAPFEQTRIDAMPDAIASRRSDVMCLFEVDDDVTVRSPIIKAAAGSPSAPGQYPYSFDIVTTTATLPTATADQRPAPANPPCAGSVPSADVSSWLNCVDQNCSTVTNDTTGSGTLNGTSSCLENSCFSPLLKLRNEATDCWNCTVFYLSTVHLSEAQKCLTNDEQAFAFDGQTPSMMLSHYPLSNTKSYILPATGFRRAVLKAQVKLEDQTVDFFCVQLSSPFIDGSVPYTGYYGSDSNPDTKNGWEDEQDLQAKEAVAWIQSETKADNLPAIIGTDLHSNLGPGVATSTGNGAGVMGTDAGIAAALSPEVYTTFETAFQVGEPPNFVSSCDYCPSPINPYNGVDVGNEIIHLFLYKFPVNATQAETFWGNDNNAIAVTSLPGEPAPPSGKGPLLEYVAHSYELLRP